MSLPTAEELESACAVLSKYGRLRRLHLGGLQAEFYEPPKSDLSEPSESGQVTAPAAAPAYATPAQSGNSDEPVKPDVFDVLGSGSPIPGAPERGAISGA